MKRFYLLPVLLIVLTWGLAFGQVGRGIVGGIDWASPGAIGGTTPAAGTFTDLTITGTFLGSRDLSTQAYTASGNITEAQILASKFITNQGAGAEIDLLLPDLEYYVTVIFIVNEAFIIEINPPNSDAHEAFDLDGTPLDLSDCIDSPIIIGSKISATRMQIADATWKWSFDTIRGAWVDTDATD